MAAGGAAGAAGLDEDRAAFYSTATGRGHRACVVMAYSVWESSARGETGTVADFLSVPLSCVPILMVPLALMLASALKHRVYGNFHRHGLEWRALKSLQNSNELTTKMRIDSER